MFRYYFVQFAINFKMEFTMAKKTQEKRAKTRRENQNNKTKTTDIDTRENEHYKIKEKNQTSWWFGLVVSVRFIVFGVSPIPI